MKTGKLYIDGKWIMGKKQFDSINPNTGEILGIVQYAQKEDVDNAVLSAKLAFDTWSKLPILERIAIVKKAADILVEMYGNAGENTTLKDMITQEMGKRLPEADIEVIESSDMMAFFTKNMAKLLSPREMPLNKEMWPTKRSVVEFEPLGVIGIIKAWNYPLELPVWSLAPALISGNTVVFKPSEYSSFVGLEIAKIFESAGLPKGVLNVITGDSETGKALVAHSDVKMIDFTGSVEVGKEISEICAKQFKRCSLELGGNDAAIILNDADIELAANGLVWGAFCNSGQVCVGVKRVFVVHGTENDNLISKIVEKASSLVPERDYGPMVSKAQLDVVEDFVQDAVEKGAKILVGGKRISEKVGFYYEPTVLSDVKESMKLMQHECFGPLLPISIVKDTETAINLTNNTIYGLGASIWTKNKDKAIDIARKIESGMVWINDVNVAFPESPWGGVKYSGIGFALSEDSIYEYVKRKHISIDESNDNKRFWWYPYI